MDADAAGRAVSIFGMLGLVLIGFVQCIRIMRRPGTQSFCVLGLALFLVALLVLVAGPIADHIAGVTLLPGFAETLPLPPSTSRFLMIVLCLGSITLATIGLINNGSQGRSHDRGRKPGIWAICLSSVLGAFAISDTARRDLVILRGERLLPRLILAREVMSLPDLNFRIRVPDEPWVAVSPHSFNPDASVAFMRGRPQAFFMIIAEDVGSDLGLTREALCELAKASLRSDFQSVKFHGADTIETLGGVEFTRFTSTVTRRGARGRLAFVHRIAEHRGFVYQLVYWRRMTYQADDVSDSREIARHFELVDPDRVAEGESPMVDDVRDAFHGFETKLATWGWSAWEGLEESFPEAHFGAQYKYYGAFVLTALDLGELPSPDLDGLTMTLLDRVLGLDYPGDEIRAAPYKDPTGVTGYDLEAEAEVDGETIVYRMRVLRRARMAYLLASWIDKAAEENLAWVESALDGVEFRDPEAGAPPPMLSDAHRILRRNLLNDIGLLFYEKGQYDVALSYYRKSYDVSADAIVLSNTASALERLGRSEEAIELLDTHRADFSDRVELLALRGAILQRKGDLEDAIASYAEAFERSHGDPDDLLAYLDLLISMEKNEDAIRAIDAFVERHPGQKNQLWRASVYSQTGKDDAAIDLLEQMLTKNGSDSKVVYALGEICNEAGQYTRAAEAADLLLEKGYRTSRTYLLRGWSEYHRKRYRKARDSFERARAKDPGDQQITSALEYASAALGRGESSAIASEIAPVSLPEEIEILLEDRPGAPSQTKEYGARLAHYVTGFHYEPEKPIRKTLYQKIEILDRSGLDRFSTLQFSFDPQHENIAINKVEVRNSKTEVAAVTVKEDCYVLDDSSTVVASQDKVLQIPVRGLKVGSTLEVAITWEDRSPARSFGYQAERVHPFRAWGNFDFRSRVRLEGLRLASESAEAMRHEESSSYSVWKLSATQSESDPTTIQFSFRSNASRGPAEKYPEYQKAWQGAVDSLRVHVEFHPAER